MGIDWSNEKTTISVTKTTKQKLVRLNAIMTNDSPLPTWDEVLNEMIDYVVMNEGITLEQLEPKKQPDFEILNG